MNAKGLVRVVFWKSGVENGPRLIELGAKTRGSHGSSSLCQARFESVRRQQIPALGTVGGLVLQEVVFVALCSNTLGLR